MSSVLTVCFNRSVCSTNPPQSNFGENARNEMMKVPQKREADLRHSGKKTTINK